MIWGSELTQPKLGTRKMNMEAKKTNMILLTSLTECQLVYKKIWMLAPTDLIHWKVRNGSFRFRIFDKAIVLLCKWINVLKKKTHLGWFNQAWIKDWLLIKIDYNLLQFVFSLNNLCNTYFTTLDILHILRQA